MTTISDRTRGARGLRGASRRLSGGVAIAVAMAVMNLGTYGFQIVAARTLGPVDYGAVASLMAMLLVIGVLQLGLQATAARRIAADPDHVAQIERVILKVTYRAAVALGLLMLVATPVVWKVLRLDSPVPALLLAVAAVPLTIMGGQAGILQGERRWQPLALVYLAVGVPRLVIGSLCILVSPTEGAAMFGVMAGLFVPVVIGWWALRRERQPGRTSLAHTGRPVARETLVSSVALLAFFTLSNMDIVVARNVLDDHDAGLYAGGLILTKAVLFLPQFVVVVAFPSMSTERDRLRALQLSLALVLTVGILCTVATWLLSGVALVFIGGNEYADVQSRLWLFAVLGTLLSMLQLLVYSVLARQGTRSGYLVWAAVAALLVMSVFVSSLTNLATTVILIDASLFVVLLVLSLYRLRRPSDAALGRAGG